MIVCGIIQSPERDNDQLVVHQVAGKPQVPDSIINAQIVPRLTRDMFNHARITARMPWEAERFTAP